MQPPFQASYVDIFIAQSSEKLVWQNQRDWRSLWAVSMVMSVTQPQWGICYCGANTFSERLIYNLKKGFPQGSNNHLVNYDQMKL